MKRKTLLLSGLLLLGALSFGKTYQIGSSQIIEHPALDAVREGVEQELKANNIDYKFDSQIAQGDMTTQQLIMQKFAQDKKDFIVTISTPTAQAGINATKDIPVLFGAVTDPKQAGITEEMGNVTGITDKVAPQTMIDLTKKLLPQAKKIAVIYNPSEKNSEVTIEIYKELVKQEGLELIAIGVTATSELPSAVDVALSKADVLHTISDNLTVAAAPLIYSKAKAKKMPVIAMEGVSQVKIGALAGFEVDYKDSGVQIGKMIIQMIEGKDIKDIPIINPTEYPVLINEEVAESLGITVPDDLKNK